MRKKLCFMISTVMVTAGMVQLAMGGEVGPGVGLENKDTYTPPAEVGPGVVPAVASDDFLHLEVPNPIVKVTDKYSYDQMAEDMLALQRVYGDKVRISSIGESLDGRAIYDIMVGNPNASKHLMIQGGMHAREYMTPLIMMAQVELALYYYNQGHYNRRALSDMFQNVAVHFVPMTNPDGIALSQFGIGAIGSEALRQEIYDCYSRDSEKGRTTDSFQTYLTKWKSNARGVDLNNNFEAGWDRSLGSAPAPSYAGYKGETPLSEPESQALAAFVDQYPWTATVSYHSQGEIIYWDSSTSVTKTGSHTLAQAISATTGYRLNGSDGRSGFKDWMQSKPGGVPSVTLEVGTVPCPLPVSEYTSAWSKNKGVWVQAMDFVMRH